MWEQFEKPELDGRLQLIAGYLANKIDKRHIVDLNCGTAPLLQWLPRGTDGKPQWGWYFGNDTNEGFVFQARERESWHTTFLCNSDADVLDILREGCIYPDILLCLGYAARLNEHESQTLDDTVKDLVLAYEPEIVILEFWSQLSRDSGIPELIMWLQKGYNHPYVWKLRPLIFKTEYDQRTIAIFEKNNA